MKVIRVKAQRKRMHDYRSKIVELKPKAAAFDLVVTYELTVEHLFSKGWRVSRGIGIGSYAVGKSDDLTKAIEECVADLERKGFNLDALIAGDWLSSLNPERKRRAEALEHAPSGHRTTNAD